MRQPVEPVAITWSPPTAIDSGAGTMSVLRPAMFVATVMRPGSPACATIAASSASCLALSTRCGSPALSNALRVSDASTERVPISTG
jgi:hypothetical protein